MTPAVLENLASNRALVMAILNVTPDSFSDGGIFSSIKMPSPMDGKCPRWVPKSLMSAGESTRPNATPLSVDEELESVLPAVKGLADAGAFVSIDTMHHKRRQRH